MKFEDKSIQCSDCGKAFTFTSEEQEFFNTKGFTNEPKRCPDCRRSRKSDRQGGDSYGARREMHSVICAQCGKETTVPFQPSGDRPVYCRDCFTKTRTSRY